MRRNCVRIYSLSKNVFLRKATRDFLPGARFFCCVSGGLAGRGEKASGAASKPGTGVSVARRRLTLLLLLLYDGSGGTRCDGSEDGDINGLSCFGWDGDSTGTSVNRRRLARGGVARGATASSGKAVSGINEMRTPDADKVPAVFKFLLTRLTTFLLTRTDKNTIDGHICAKTTTRTAAGWEELEFPAVPSRCNPLSPRTKPKQSSEETKCFTAGQHNLETHSHSMRRQGSPQSQSNH